MTRRRTEGDKLVDQLSGVLGDTLEFSERETALLGLIRDQRNELARLEGLAAQADPETAGGSRVLRETRLSRAALSRLLSQLGLPDALDAPVTGSRQQRAANLRWARERWKGVH